MLEMVGSEGVRVSAPKPQRQEDLVLLLYTKPSSEVSVRLFVLHDPVLVQLGPSKLFH
jgi:hypothetical protein